MQGLIRCRATSWESALKMTIALPPSSTPLLHGIHHLIVYHAPCRYIYRPVIMVPFVLYVYIMQFDCFYMLHINTIIIQLLFNQIKFDFRNLSTVINASLNNKRKKNIFMRNVAIFLLQLIYLLHVLLRNNY